MFGAVGPVVAPADNEVATVKGMAVVVEILALKLKFDRHPLPSAGDDLSPGLAIGKFLLNCLDHEAEIFCQHSEEDHDAVFVHRFIPKPLQVDGITVGRPVF